MASSSMPPKKGGKSPKCMIVHVQRSRLLSLSDRGPVVWNPNLARTQTAPSAASSPPSPDNEYSVSLSETKRFSQTVEPREGSGVHSIEELEEGVMRSGRSGRSGESELIERFLEERSKQVQSSSADDGFILPDSEGIYISSCGHSVHQKCLSKYLFKWATMRQEKWARLPDEERKDSAKIEFSCHECRELANSVLFRPREGRSSEQVPPSDPGIFSSSSSTGEGNLRLAEAVSLMHDAAVGIHEVLRLIPSEFDQQLDRPGPELEPLLHTLGEMYDPSRSEAFVSGQVNSSLLLWEVLRYSVASTEVDLRFQKLVVAPRDCNTTALALLLKTVQSLKVRSKTTTFLRYKGIQLLEESLCSGSSNGDCKRRRVYQLFSLGESDSEPKFMDVQFLKMASDPVLASDSFSTLMRAVFCLPNSFLSSKKHLFCLVHIFYLVTVTQGIVVCCRKRECELTELHLTDCLITDVSEFILDHLILFGKIDSNYVNSSGDMKETIRRLSIPFLRRCFLLWQLITTSEATVEDESLESFFRIPPIDAVINDDKSRSMAKQWLQNFTKEYKPRQHVLYCTPSQPCNLLMVLPPKYMDLLEGYYKRGCPKCSKYIKEPAVCLFCGTLCGSGPKYCCREFSCDSHAMACGAGVGVFLLYHKTSTLLQSGVLNALWYSLYLNEHGEEDTNLRQLRLKELRYNNFNHMIASHGLHSRVFKLTKQPLRQGDSDNDDDAVVDDDEDDVMIGGDEEDEGDEGDEDEDEDEDEDDGEDDINMDIE